jgi:hypothetical protein
MKTITPQIGARVKFNGEFYILEGIYFAGKGRIKNKKHTLNNIDLTDLEF